MALPSLEAALASHRFGMGTGPKDRAARAGGRAWLRGQVPGPAAQPKGAKRLPGTAALLSTMRPLKGASQAERMAFVRASHVRYRAEIAARLIEAARTGAPFKERLVWYWSNHFTISTTNNRVVPFAGPFEREAIRPHLGGRFEDLLIAVVRHPAMLIYLDNVSSVGPTSLAGQRRGRGLNENLAREILELHTLGVDGGYSQDDVLALAKILTGWSAARAGDESPGGFVFRPRLHEPGAQTLLGARFGGDRDEAQGLDALRFLARRPETARYVARRFAGAFHAAPPPSAVASLERAFLETGGSLPALHQALLDEPAFWEPELGLVRPPIDYVSSVLRLSGDQGLEGLNAFLDLATTGEPGTVPLRKAVRGNRQAANGLKLIETLRAMGQYPFMAPSPKGWPMQPSAWTGPDQLLERAEWAHAVALMAPSPGDPAQLAGELLGPLLTPSTRTTLSEAASPAQGLALFLASPEFQSR
ncbi:MAG: DUF1800 domain-containing protein [Pseudomonadota bacterium]